MLVFIHANFKLDLTYLSVTFTEINQWFKDGFSTQQSFPFDLYLDPELSKSSGFEAHYNANQNQTIFHGYLDSDGELTGAVLKFLSIKGAFINSIITVGLDNFPSFDKKLSELNLETKSVTSLVDNANEVIVLGYPDTNYNFPMIHTDKYDPTSNEWNGFEKIINNYSAGAFLENELVLTSNIDLIRNILQPLPYLLHILKIGITDGGKILAGDILEDFDLNRALVWRDGEYYNQLLSEEIPMVLKNNEYSRIAYTLNGYDHMEFTEEIIIDKKGDYILFGTVVILKYKRKWLHGVDRVTRSFVGIYKDSAGTSSVLHNEESINTTDSGVGANYVATSTINIDMPLSLEVGDRISILKIEPRRDQVPSPTPDYPEAVSLKLIPIRYRNPDGSPILSVLNLNEIDLKKTVPDMTVRDLVTVIKNWFNYEFIQSGDYVYMNKIENKLNRASALQLEDTEIEEPERTFHEDREYELSFSDGNTDDTYKYDSVLITKESTTINNYILKDTVNQIKIDALPLPIITRNAVTTAYSFTEETSKLRLVFMKPMSEEATPMAYHNENVLMPAIYTNNFKKWLDFRINSIAWNWEFIMSVEKFRAINIQTLIYAYSNYHILSEIEKERINSMFWRITAKTESLI